MKKINLYWVTCVIAALAQIFLYIATDNTMFYTSSQVFVAALFIIGGLERNND